MDLFTAIEQRRSPTRLAEPAPNSEQLARILGAAICAPDHGRLSPWRFHVLQGERRAILSAALEGLLRRKYPEVNAEMIAAERAKAQRAPMIIAVAARILAAHKVPEVEQLMAVAAATQNLLLAATALGFGSMWKTGAPAYDNQVKTALGFEPGDQIVGFIYLGTAAAPPKPRVSMLNGVVRHL